MSAARSIEIVNPHHPRGPFQAAIFDFDGTLSLLRRNWQEVMIPMMVEILAATGTQESHGELHAHVEDFVMRLNGKQTIYQMMQLAEEVAKVNADMVVVDDGGKPWSVRYDEVNAMFLNEFLKEHRKVEHLEKQVEKLTAGLQRVNDKLEMSKAAPQTVANSQ